MATKTSPKTKKKAKKKQQVKEGKIYIKCTYNNTVISATDAYGNLLVQSSPGRVGFGGTRKATPYAAQKAVADVLERLKPFNMKEAAVFVKGIGSARDSAVRSLNTTGLSLTSVKDITPIPHNGVRAPKRRRV